ncbi:quaternary ammonium compound efflux SMR transporter SugE [Vibrio sp. CAU 1672]|uniref:quaternary ammonium compound efflux SMR transporter SugE n=1 Tax=Vibrio sp. CAU 1672 TaxID=3032594 RepID=UPI0023DBADB2|nr:quaternary ammonium compound efflux SMR transporter SugE [Vibrio sp. CAU 1672]MDF2153366.1 quaternary ammonium compound efflux SMR transporter SugE [Vibrio sp. CAU 1672]
MAWAILVLAGVCEVIWALGLKYSDGFSKLFPSLFTLVFMLLSFGLLGLALRSLPLGAAYGTWVGIGAIGTAIAGMWLLGEPVNPTKLVSLSLIVCGIAGLKLTS